MKIRHVVRTVAATSVATLCGAAFVLALGVGPAGAGQVASPTLVNGPTTLTANGTPTVAAGTPYSAGQTITVSGSANSTLQASAPNVGASGFYSIIECQDPNGNTLPTQPSDCEGGTEDSSTVTHSSDGSFSDSGYGVFVLPDANFGSSTFTGHCGVAPNFCVIGIFANDPFAAGFTSSNPHLWSAPFQVQPSTGSHDSGGNPGDGTPEVPLAIGLPLAGLAAFGAWTIRSRRRRANEAHAAV